MVLERKVRHFPDVPILQFLLQFLDGCVSSRVFFLKWDSLQVDFFNSYNYSFIHFLDVNSLKCGVQFLGQSSYDLWALL